LSIYVNKNNGFHQDEPIARECPHCGAHAQLLPLSTPSYETLMSARPRHVGIVYRCAACNEPRFVRLAVRAFEEERVELAASFIEIERVRERFQYSYLPDKVERLLRESLECYTAGCHDAFASMCRRTLHAALAGADVNARRRWQEIVRDVLMIAEVDAEGSRVVDDVLFGDREPPEMTPDQSAILIEVVKDLFFQTYVRTAKLRGAMKMRRFFAGETLRNVTPIGRSRHGNR
jgi:hypothetical protein